MTVLQTSVGPASVLHRLALGLVVRDAVTSRPVDGVRVGWEAPVRRLPRNRPAWWPCLDLEPLGGGRHRLLVAPRPDDLVLRIVDPSRRFVARRLGLGWWPFADLVDDADPIGVAARTLNAWLAPGAAYPSGGGATALRGSLTRAGAPLPWGRVVAVGPGSAVLGRAHADDRGEFLLLLRETNQNPVQAGVGVSLRIRGPRDIAAPDPDPYSALPVEPVTRPADPPGPGDLDNPLLRGTTPPAAYTTNAVAPVQITLRVGAEQVRPEPVPFEPAP